MLPFELLTIPNGDAETELGRSRPGLASVLVGDGDIFFAEWSEYVDDFLDPHEIIASAEAMDFDSWYAEYSGRLNRAVEREMWFTKLLCKAFRVVAFPVDVVLFPVRLVRWAISGSRPAFLSRLPADKTPEDVAATAAELWDDDDSGGFPDPIRYVIPSEADGELATALIEVDEPWQAMAWFQHGEYAQMAPIEAHVAHAKILWERYGARIVSVSIDHIGFELERPVTATSDALAVMDRFFTFGAEEINAETFGGTGESLIGAKRWWVWWDWAGPRE